MERQKRNWVAALCDLQEARLHRARVADALAVAESFIQSMIKSGLYECITFLCCSSAGILHRDNPVGAGEI